MTEHVVQQLGYLGISLILVLGGLGLPIPEEVPIILAAVLSKHGQMWWPFAVTACMAGVLVGDFIVYFLGYFYGEKVLSFRFTRRFLSKARETQIKGYFHRHGFKILVLGRFAVGFRTAAYLTAGILQLPPLKLLATDFLAASLSTFLMFGLGFLFANQIQSGLHEFQQWMMLLIGLLVVSWLFHRFFKARRRGAQQVGPPVQLEDELFPPLISDAAKMSGLLDDHADHGVLDPASASSDQGPAGHEIPSVEAAQTPPRPEPTGHQATDPKALRPPAFTPRAGTSKVEDPSDHAVGTPPHDQPGTRTTVVADHGNIPVARNRSSVSRS